MLNNKLDQIAEAKNRKFLQTSIMPKSRNGQIAEGMTWLIATIVIIVTLTVFIFLSLGLAKSKDLVSSTSVEKLGNFWFKGNPLPNRVSAKTFFALSLNEKNEEVINNWIKNEK